MAYKDGFVIEYTNQGSRISCYKCVYFNKHDKDCNKTGVYVPDVARDKWKKCAFFELADDYDTDEMRQKAARARALAQGMKQSKKQNSKKKNSVSKKDKQVGSVPSVKGLHVGRAVCDSRNRVGHVQSLTNTVAKIQFEDGTVGRFKIPDDFADGVIRIQRYDLHSEGKSVSKKRNRNSASIAKQQSRSELDGGSPVGRKVYSANYGQGKVVASENGWITVVFSKGRKRVRFNAETARRDGALRLES